MLKPSLLAAAALAMLALSRAHTVAAADPVIADEFVGPFASWTNVKTAYGTVGDGVADDTAALQHALTDINPDTRPVIYLPAGTYRLTATLHLASQQLVSVVGADPATVTLVWDGPAAGTMLAVNGVAYSRIGRIRFDGRQKADIAVDQSAEKGAKYFDTGNAYDDDEFVDVGYGIHGGFKDGGGFAETSIVRGRFIRNTKAGVALGNFNALDAWIWFSLFDHCAEGVSNEPGAGNYRVYSSVFRGSTVADLMMQNTGIFSARDNYSVGSKAFYVSTRTVSHPADIDIHHNTIVDPVDATAIHLTNQGPALILDNVFRSLPGAVGPVISWQTTFGASIASIGNTFTVAKPVSVDGTLVTTDDKVVGRDTLAPVEPTLPPHPPQVTRPIIDVPRGANGAVIQAAIDRAAAMTGDHPVVHVPFGPHPIEAGLEIAPGRVEIIGDGFATILRPTGDHTEPVMHVAGPTQVAVRELSIQGNATRDGLVIDGIDQAGARIRFDGLQARGAAVNNIRVESLAHAAVELIDINHTSGSKEGSVRVLGPSAEPAGDRDGRTVIFSGASSDNALSYDIGGGTAVIRDIWYESGRAAEYAHLHGGANVTLQGVRLATPLTSAGPTAITVDNVGGQTTMLTSDIDDGIRLAAPAGKVLGFALMREFAKTPFIAGFETAGPDAHFALNRQRAEIQGRFSIGTAPLSDMSPVDATVLKAFLMDTRQFVAPSLAPVPAGATDLRISRVASDGSRSNVVIRR